MIPYSQVKRVSVWDNNSKLVHESTVQCVQMHRDDINACCLDDDARYDEEVDFLLVDADGGSCLSNFIRTHHSSEQPSKPTSGPFQRQQFQQTSPSNSFLACEAIEVEANSDDENRLLQTPLKGKTEARKLLLSPSSVAAGLRILEEEFRSDAIDSLATSREDVSISNSWIAQSPRDPTAAVAGPLLSFTNFEEEASVASTSNSFEFSDWNDGNRIEEGATSSLPIFDSSLSGSTPFFRSLDNTAEKSSTLCAFSLWGVAEAEGSDEYGSAIYECYGEVGASVTH
jgi:hypothetical protein